MKDKADIGLVGLAVMGENLILNMESKGFTVACFNRTVRKVDDFVNGRGAGKNFIGGHSIEELVNSLERPRKVMMLVKAGAPVDGLIEQLIPHVEKGDIITLMDTENLTRKLRTLRSEAAITSATVTHDLTSAVNKELDLRDQLAELLDKRAFLEAKRDRYKALPLEDEVLIQE